ncbi:alpha/beta hydrolase [Caryophanon tenue]|uniref:Esterase n=1 Tax=Caryophanon tenue TaxID=33978 RepID=A0A1C0Y6N4_9BACL|nr:alpha/beta hydrolase [Caryophanon tenue]OCS82803.1 esterase [Caryophanon tenue]
MKNEDYIVLEPAAQAFANENEAPPYLYELPVEEGRKTVDDAQSGDVEKYDVSKEVVKGIQTPSGTVDVTLYKPINAGKSLPVMIYAHGGGWVFGNEHTHDRLMRELTYYAQQAIVFVHYSLSPEAKYPTALEEMYAVTKWAVEHAEQYGFNAEHVTVAGDSAGGNLATATAILAKQRGTPTIHKQVLYYPVTDARFDTPSYEQFARGFFLHRDGMKWFWDQYTTSEVERALITVSPLRATVEELADLPKALILTAETDVLRDEGERYAAKLRQAGVDVTSVRVPGIIHDFMMLNALKDTNAYKVGMTLTAIWLQKA